jgi:hypothetical protein
LIAQNKATVTVDTTNIRIGEQFKLNIEVNETNNVILPKLILNGLEVVDSTSVDTLKNSLVQKYTLTGFDSGAFYIPQQQIFIRNQAFLTDSILINVATVAVDTTKVKKFPIKAIKKEPITFDDYKIYIYLALAILAVIAFWIYWFVIRKRKEDDEAPTYRALPPYEEALYRLNELDEKLLWQNNKIKEYYSELTDIIRGYIERELNIPALENTTDNILELVRQLKQEQTIDTSQDVIDTLRGLLREADLVKFAKSKPMAHAIETNRKEADIIIANLKPKPVKKEENDDELE